MCVFKNLVYRVVVVVLRVIVYVALYLPAQSILDDARALGGTLPQEPPTPTLGFLSRIDLMDTWHAWPGLYATVLYLGGMPRCSVSAMSLLHA